MSDVNSRYVVAFFCFVAAICLTGLMILDKSTQSDDPLQDHLSGQSVSYRAVADQDQLDSLRRQLQEGDKLYPCRLLSLQPYQSYEAHSGLYWILLDCAPGTYSPN
jgi:hypothetical protein